MKANIIYTYPRKARITATVEKSAHKMSCDRENKHFNQSYRIAHQHREGNREKQQQYILNQKTSNFSRT